MEKPMRVQVVILLIGFGIGLLGCQTMGYYSQAIDGQLSILINRQSITELLADTETPENLKTRLSYVLEVRDFAQTELQLPVGNNYLDYVDIQRNYVVWNVFAAPEFSLVPKTWCYPIAGCVAYRGYFSEQNARQYAESLKKENYDVYIGGAIAYSTLGWFDDPVLSTITYLSKPESAALIFHELAHQLLYVPDDTAFNESFATLVEHEGVRRWLITRDDSDTYEAFLVKYQQHRQFVDLIMRYRGQLDSLYQSNLSESEKRGEKAALFNQLKKDHDRLNKEWNGTSRYEPWFRHSLNNAKLVSVLAYHDFVPVFRAILKEKDGDLKQFYAECLRLSRTPREKRHRILANYFQ
jgi:predicted aminopeptidase